ncbi:hypothetical protein ACFL6M_04555 [Candidatus Eisenbacteria bacterium]|uniref:Uncharacterized protein n=1 Tax=Eiseniibacteriota bacterium TaxID=2212470 RepID=A0ABV6YKH7_UNCEI
MRTATFILILLAICSGTVSADSPYLGPAQPEKDDSHVTGVPVGGDMVAGDTIEQAWVVASLPFTGTGNTCLFNDDYDETCPYSGSVSPDVVYAFAPGADMMVSFDLCDGWPYSYDTKLYIYEDVEGNLIACDDDGCGSALGYASRIWHADLSAGHVYYIVVDGYGGDCGNYLLRTPTDPPPCIIECPPEALLEGEPLCYNGYEDLFNGGCHPNVFSDVFPCDGEPITVCGTGGVYYFGTSLYRDTDWYQLDTAAPDVVSWTVESNRPFAFIFLDGTEGCGNPVFIGSHESEPCEPYTFANVQLTYPGRYWLWAGANGWNPEEFPCDDTNYVWTLYGFTGEATPVEKTTWGRVKKMFR